MQLNITKETTRTFVTRMRQALGLESVSQSKAYEVFAQAVGVKNWDTLSGILSKEEAAVVPSFTLQAPVELYIDAFACSEYADGPAWAMVYLTQEFINELLRLQSICKDNRLEFAVKSAYADDWQNQEEYRLTDDKLYVSQSSWWFRSQPKHADYHVESRYIELEDLFAVLNGGTNKYLAFRKDKLMYDATGNVQNLVAMLVDSGNLDESYLEV